MTDFPGVTNYKNITYVNLVGTIVNSGLIPGQYYRITDFADAYFITDADDNQYVTGDGIKVGPNEPLIVLATSANTIDKEARSEAYPEDIIYYDWNPANWLDDLSFADLTGSPVIHPSFKGVIYFRHDTLLDNVCGYDFRNIEFRRWESSPDEWDAETDYIKGSIVKETASTNGIYIALKAVSGAKTQVDTLTLTGSGGAGTIDGNIITYSTDLATTALNFKTAFAATYLALGIILTNSGADLIFTAQVLGTGFTSPVFSNTSPDLDGTVVNTQPNIPITLVTDNTSWVLLVNLSVSLYWNFSPTSTHNIISGAAYQDFKTFAEGTGDATYEKQCRSNHFGSFKDTNSVQRANATLLSNNVIFLANETTPATFENTILFPFLNTISGNSFYLNTISDGFNMNTIGNSFSYNTVGSECAGNTIGNSFKSNTVGSDCANNVIGDNSRINTIGIVFLSNTIGANFVGNTIGNGVNGNTVGISFAYNTIGNVFEDNIIGDGFTKNTTEEDINTLDFSSSTYVYLSYSKRILKDSLGVFKLTYIDGTTGLLVVVDATA